MLFSTNSNDYNNADDTDRLLTEAQYNTLLWVAALAVLECPMSVEDKIKTLREKIKNEGENITAFVYPTGLPPFDAAIENLLYS